MKKLLCLVLLTTMIVGRSSKDKEEDKVGANSNLITQMLDDVDNNKKAGEKDTPSTSFCTNQCISSTEWERTICLLISFKKPK